MGQIQCLPLRSLGSGEGDRIGAEMVGSMEWNGEVMGAQRKLGVVRAAFLEELVS